MQLRVVAIPLIAAICLGSPALARTPDEQMVNGRGARDRNGGGNSGGNNGGSAERPSGSGDRRDGGSTSTTTARSGDQRRRDNGGEQRAAVRRGDDNRDNNRGDDQRIAVRRAPDRNRSYNPPVIVRNSRPNININIGNSFRPRFHSPFYYDRWARSYYRWSPIGYAPWSLIYGSIGFSNLAFYGAFPPSTYYYGYNNYYGPGAYSPWQVSGYDIGGVRLKIRPRDAQVFVDGYYAGIVDDFDGTFQSLRLEAGGHKIEIHMPGFEDLELDVHVQPGRTITLEEILRPRP
jgi:PEGA domain-containing protein